ncbi:hypothetical protein CONLIGDRAFT_140266 [Coniochaeta ligniaria NRRL 30616]|uniref:Uncharacterized protein n=1 Tax=Coniochaeta ligniaria NRRL 30616 TaxID=1408157 RepID=A0A1J7IRH0_9PEZI|nr:hypothetical protein CONLIGDRAFT_140266 [Coniochaeta ligniaria NRRL 30616]
MDGATDQLHLSTNSKHQFLCPRRSTISPPRYRPAPGPRASSPPFPPSPSTEMAMTGGMALAGDPFRENKETSAYWTKEEAGPNDFFDEYVILDDDDPLGPGAHTSRTYYEDLDFAPAERFMTPPTSIDTSQLVSAAESTDGRAHLQPHAALAFQHPIRYGTPGPQRLTQQALEEQSGPGLSSAQRRFNSSVSDTELQRLEDLSMQSPRRGTATAPPQHSHSIPVSPRMVPATPSQHDPLGISFVSGQYDDPFEGTFPGQHGHVVGYPPQQSYQDMMLAGHTQGGQAPPNWPLTDGYASSSANSVDEMVWAGNTHQQHIPPQTPAGQAWYPATPGNPMKSVTRQSSSEFGTQSAMNATLNLALHLQQGGQIYHNNHHHHYGPVAGGHHHSHSENGLQMHMPQPRQPTAPILHPSQLPLNQHSGGHGHSLSMDAHTQSYLAPPTHPRPPRAGHHAHDPSTPRRPKPRAPSSGARHTSLSLTSPRKPPPLPHQPRGRSSSSSPSKSTTSRSARRVTSASDLHSTPTKSELPSAGVLNSSIRKRRSRSKSMSRTSRTDLRTPSQGSLSSTADSPTKVAQIGFVNYTPDDCKVLMTGVAPSGSSKTKARREREAAERQRRMSEAVMKAVAAAGGDVGRLREEGIVIDGDDGMGGMMY